MKSDEDRHFPALDGWRGISILLVLSAHLLPLGPKQFAINGIAARAGMALFFTLSGFLITRTLIKRGDVRSFLIHRLFRILPLAWLSLIIAFPLAGVPLDKYLPNFLFFANLPPIRLANIDAHFWSLDVEIQFYCVMAFMFVVGGKKSLWLIPILSIAIGIHRVLNGATADIVTWRRGDEILSGSLLAMAISGNLGSRIPGLLKRVNVYVLCALLVITSLPAVAFVSYFRPYIAATLVGATLYGTPRALATILCSKYLRYLAQVSFALYVIHGFFLDSWLGSGDKLAKYAKRPLLVAVTFGLAHLSTFYFERRWMDLGKRLTEHTVKGRPPITAPGMEGGK